MGLDMLAKTKDAEGNDLNSNLAFWRKHPNLHGWMEALYREKGGTEEQFNCIEVELTQEDLLRLQQDLLGQKLPEKSGFFFGRSRPEYIEGDLLFVAKALFAISQGQRVFYDSWW